MRTDVLKEAVVVGLRRLSLHADFHNENDIFALRQMREALAEEEEEENKKDQRIDELQRTIDAIRKEADRDSEIEFSQWVKAMIDDPEYRKAALEEFKKREEEKSTNTLRV